MLRRLVRGACRAFKGIPRTYEKVFDRLRRHAFFVTIGLVLLVGVVDPLGITSGTNAISERLIYRIVAPHYQKADPASITVVLLDDESVAKLNSGRGYPIGMGDHGLILEQILCERPKAVFMDIAFRNARDDDNSAELAEAARMRKRGDSCDLLEPGDPDLQAISPVLVGRVEAPGSGCDIAFGEVSETCGNASLLDFLQATRPVTLSGMPDDTRYPMVAATREASGGENSPTLTPAPQLFEIACRDMRYAPGCDDRNTLTAKLEGRDTVEEARTTLPALSIQWGLTTSPEQTECPEFQRETSSLGRILLSAEIFLNELLGNFSLWQKALGQGGLCTTFDTLNVNALFDLSTSDAQRLSSLIQDRIVLYGVSVTAIPDQIITDLHGTLPGVYSHAGALDNLFRFGARYWHDPPEAKGVSTDNMLELFVTLILIGFGELLRAAHAGTRPALLARLPRIPFPGPVVGKLAATPNFTYTLVSLAVIVATLIVTMAGFSWAPINVLGMLGLVTLANPAMR